VFVPNVKDVDRSTHVLSEEVVLLIRHSVVGAPCVPGSKNWNEATSVAGGGGGDGGGGGAGPPTANVTSVDAALKMPFAELRMRTK